MLFRQVYNRPLPPWGNTHYVWIKGDKLKVKRLQNTGKANIIHNYATCALSKEEGEKFLSKQLLDL